MSIGSLGEDQAEFATVSNILFDSNTVASALYAARFKSWIGGQGLVTNVTWSNLQLYNVTQPILVTQTYVNQGSSQTQLTPGQVSGRPNNASVVMRDFTWANITGSINSYAPGDLSCVTDPCWYDVGLPDLDSTQAIVVECNTASSCQGFAFDNIQLWPQRPAGPSVVCINATAALNPALGFECANGSYVPL